MNTLMMMMILGMMFIKFTKENSNNDEKNLH